MESLVARQWSFGIGTDMNNTYSNPYPFEALFDDQYDAMFADLYSTQESETT
jgi:hypothetical protein